GSQAWKGNWADLVNAASTTRISTAVAMPVLVSQTSSARIALRRLVPVATTITTTAASRHSPPSTVTSRVRIAGSRANGPERAIKKYEHNVVTSHATYSNTTSSASTKASIAAANALIHQ